MQIGSYSPYLGGASAGSGSSGVGQSSASDPDNPIVDAFRTEAKKSPYERMYDQILKGMGLTEAQLNKMPEAEQEAIRKQVEAIIQARMKMASGQAATPGSQGTTGQTGQYLDTSA